MGKKITREQVEEVSELVKHWVAENLEPGSDAIVITTERCKDGTAKVVSSNTVGGSLAVLWDDADFLAEEATTKLTIYDMVRPVTLETKPEPVNLSDMWKVFETLNYLTQKIREDIEFAVSRNEHVKPVSWVCLPGVGIGTGANVPGGWCCSRVRGAGRWF